MIKSFKITSLLITIIISSSSMSQTYSGGSGLSNDPYLIDNKADLKYLSENSSDWNKYFKQTSDITFIASDFQSGGDFYNSGKGFIPIGSESGTHFEGFYDGNSKIISNLYINRPSTKDVGLFGYTDRDYGLPHSYIKNLGLEDVNITGGYRTAGLVGRAMSDISYCYVTGSITGAAGNSVAAGLTAQCHYPITDCYSTASVSAVYEAAGFVSFNNTTITNCYSTGAVSNAATQDGFCNDLDGHGSGTLSNCFWDTQTSGQSSSSGGTGKTTAEMKNYYTFTNESTAGLTSAWDFVTNPYDDNANNDYWDMDQESTVNNGYPILYFQDGADNSLPIELIYFSANCITESSVELNWKTASETNNAHFEIQQSFDGIEFITIGKVNGAGNSNSEISYKFSHQNIENFSSYYRLKQVDFNGKFEYSKTVTVNCSDKQLSSVEVYPNPFVNEIIIDFNTITKRKQKVQLRNYLGVLIKEIYLDENNSNYKMELEENLSSGIYFIVISNDNEIIVKKLIKE